MKCFIFSEYCFYLRETIFFLRNRIEPACDKFQKREGVIDDPGSFVIANWKHEEIRNLVDDG